MDDSFAFNDDPFGLRHIHREQQRREEAVAKLVADPLMEIPEIGDTVVVACGLIGHGFDWIRKECVVVAKGQATYKVRHTGHSKPLSWEEWIHPCLVTDIIRKKLDETPACAGPSV